MSMPPTFHFQDLGPQAQAMSKNVKDERIAMILQYVAVGSMIVMAGIAASKMLKESFGPPDHHRDHDKSR